MTVALLGDRVVAAVPSSGEVTPEEGEPPIQWQASFKEGHRATEGKMPRDGGGREAVMRPQAKDRLDGWPPPAARRLGEDPPCSPWGKPGSAGTLTLNFWPPQWWENKGR